MRWRSLLTAAFVVGALTGCGQRTERTVAVGLLTPVSQASIPKGEGYRWLYVGDANIDGLESRDGWVPVWVNEEELYRSTLMRWGPEGGPESRPTNQIATMTKSIVDEIADISATLQSDQNALSADQRSSLGKSLGDIQERLADLQGRGLGQPVRNPSQLTQESVRRTLDAADVATASLLSTDLVVSLSVEDPLFIGLVELIANLRNDLLTTRESSSLLAMDGHLRAAGASFNALATSQIVADLLTNSGETPGAESNQRRRILAFRDGLMEIKRDLDGAHATLARVHSTDDSIPPTILYSTSGRK